MFWTWHASSLWAKFSQATHYTYISLDNIEQRVFVEDRAINYIRYSRHIAIHYRCSLMDVIGLTGAINV